MANIPSKTHHPRRQSAAPISPRDTIVPASEPTARKSAAKALPKRDAFSPLDYRPGGIDNFIDSVGRATPYQLVDIERRGVHGRLVKDIAKTMHLPTSRVFTILGIPKATAEKKAASGAAISGSAGQSALGMVKLLGIAQAIIANSDSPDAKGFDASKWLGQWIERPQPALGGRMPAELLDTPTGVEVVSRLLGAIESGAYQ